jgi:cytochrome P450
MRPLPIGVVCVLLLLLTIYVPWVMLLLLVLVGALVLAGVKRIPKNAPPAPAGMLPWFGHMLSIGARADVVYRNWWQRHGDIISVQLGDQLCVLVSSPALHKEVYGKHGRSLLERPPLLVRELTFAVLGGAGVLWAARDEWRAHRAFVNNNMLSASKVLGFVPAVFDEAKRCVLGFERASAGAPAHDVDVVPRLFQLAMNALSVVALGRRLFDVDEGFGAETRRAVLTIFSTLGEPQLSDYVRVLRKIVPNPPSFVKCREALTEISDIVDAEYAKRAKLHESEKNPRCIVDDVFDLDSGDNKLTSKEALRSIKELINAGGETTTAVMVWAMVAAAEEKAETQRAIEELDRVAGDSEWITPAHLADVPVFDAWLKETVRLWPLARVTVPRLTTEEVQIGGYTLPPNTMVLIHRQAIMMHPSFWREPSKFNLDRFLPGGEAFEAVDLQWAFVMFGAGPRACPGSILAMWEVRLTIANLLRRFRIDYSPAFPFDFRTDTETKLTTQPKGGKLLMKLEKRI